MYKRGQVHLLHGLINFGIKESFGLIFYTQLHFNKHKFLSNRLIGMNFY
jgi:hypothetical protein